MEQLSWIYFPTALALGALHALEPGHAKTLTAAYLIGIKGTKKDAFLLGLSVAITHSLVVILISMAALYVGKEAFTEDVTRYLQLGSGIVVILLGAWMMFRRYRFIKRQKSHTHHKKAHCAVTPLPLTGQNIQGTFEIMNTVIGEKIKFTTPQKISSENLKIFIQRPTEIEIHQLSSEDGKTFIGDQLLREPHDFTAELEYKNGNEREIIPFEIHELKTESHQHHDHDHDHAHGDHCDSHTHEIPDYVKKGDRPTFWQIFTFGAAGGMIPCPASITVMLLALSVGQVGMGLFTVMGFSLGLALALVTVGLIVVAGISRIQHSGRFSWLSKNAPILSAGVVMLSGFAALLFH